MAITIDQVKDCFELRGYQLTRETVRVQEFKAKNGYFLYAHKKIGLPDYARILIDPRLQSKSYLDIPGVSTKDPDEYFHSSNMLQFPKRRNKSEDETHYGRPLNIESEEALGVFLDRFQSQGGIALVGEEGAPVRSRPLLTAIELENFKGVGERVRLELKPITLLFGANSAGKSTILQALQYVREILERRNANPDRTIYGGEFVDLGGFRNIVHQRDQERSMKIKLDMDLIDLSLPEYVPASWDEWNVHEESVWQFYELLQGVKDKIESASVELEVRWSSLRSMASVVRYEVGFNGAWFCKLQAAPEGRDVNFELNPYNPIFKKEVTPEEQAALDESLRDLGIDPPEAGSSESKEESVSALHLISYTLGEAGIETPSSGLKRWFANLDSALPHFDRLLETPTGRAGGSANVYMARDFTAFLTSVVVGPGELLRNRLRSMRYLGPIREVPERNYEPILTPDESRWANGLGAWDALAISGTTLATRVSEWMSGSDKLNTGYKAVLSPTKTIDAAYVQALLNVAKEDSGVRVPRELVETVNKLPEKLIPTLVDAETGMELRPKDVGIGISQVLPVVVAALDETGKIVTIEQPELHIHPAIQVSLGDLFVSQINRSDQQFLIETHSEHLMLRLLRRIRETTEHDLPSGALPLRPDQLNVAFVERVESGGIRVVEIGVDEKGRWTEQWPTGFFAERMRESLPKEIREKVESIRQRRPE